MASAEGRSVPSGVGYGLAYFEGHRTLIFVPTVYDEI